MVGGSREPPTTGLGPGRRFPVEQPRRLDGARARRSSRRATPPPSPRSRRSASWASWSLTSNASPPSSRCSIEVIHQEKCSARQTRRSASSEYARGADSSPRSVPGGERLGEHADVGDGEVEPLRAGRRHDVRGVAGEEQAAVLHRLDDEAAHAGDALLEDLAGVQRPALEPEAPLELVPDPLVGPLVEILVRAAPGGRAG